MLNEIVDITRYLPDQKTLKAVRLFIIQSLIRHSQYL